MKKIVLIELEGWNFACRFLKPWGTTMLAIFICGFFSMGGIRTLRLMSQSLFDARTRFTTTLTVLPQCLLHCDKFLKFDDLTNYLTLPKHFLWPPLPLGVLKIRSKWPHWHVRILSGQANNKQNLSKNRLSFLSF